MSNVTELCYIYSHKYGAYCDFKEVHGRADVYFNRDKACFLPISREQAQGIIDRLEREQPEIIGQFQIRKG